MAGFTSHRAPPGACTTRMMGILPTLRLPWAHPTWPPPTAKQLPTTGPHLPGAPAATSGVMWGGSHGAARATKGQEPPLLCLELSVMPAIPVVGVLDGCAHGQAVHSKGPLLGGFLLPQALSGFVVRVVASEQVGLRGGWDPRSLSWRDKGETWR